ncbi:hypothetical protein ACGFIF_38445 [Kribbella sp. NPDC049174]|uniref:hypothetical protein n=1 Tax=Kribbella sp. NPDC049174 TaxID=3364112 RepID=UPI003723A4E1
MDHRRPPARRQQKSPSRQSHSPHSHVRKPQRSHSAVGAAIVAAAAMVAVFAFILTRGSSNPPTDDGLRGGAVANGGAGAPAASAPKSTDPSPSVNTAKADRKPPASSAAPKAKAQTSATPNTGATSPVFKRGQWIVVMEKYPTDVGMDAEQLAKSTAVKMITAGVPAKAMLVNGQYPGIANSSLEPVTDTWIVYLGPGTSSAQMLDLCSDSRTQRVHSSPACPTFEPAGAPGS